MMLRTPRLEVNLRSLRDICNDFESTKKQEGPPGDHVKIEALQPP